MSESSVSISAASSPNAGLPALTAQSRCTPEHDIWSLALGVFLCVGLVVSYLPQILRIVLKRSSLGFSPWFLLLGATSSASSFLNVVTLQWGTVRCCTRLSAGQCLESLVGVFQVGLQWLLFVMMLVLFLVYYPIDKRYERSIALPHSRSSEMAEDMDGVYDEDDDADDSSIGDIDSVGSRIAVNYSNFTGGQSADNYGDHVSWATPSAASGSQLHQTATESPDSSAMASRFAGPEDNDPASSSAFDRLVPSFWPMWKATARKPLGPSRLGPGLLPSAGLTSPADTDGSQVRAQPVASRADRASGSALQGRKSSRQVLLGAPNSLRIRRRRVKHRTPEWSLAQALAWVVVIHFLFILLVTLLLVATLPTSAFPPPQQPPLPVPPVTDPSRSRTSYEAFSSPSSRLLVNRWAAFLGITGTLLAAAQYVPQIVHTTRMKVVGSLSIPMMCLQVPGSVIFVYSLAIRPGIDWTSLVAYICAGALQLVLLILCLCWTVRQKRLGIDEYGNPASGLAEPLFRQEDDPED